jgi:hypothetical protein
MQSSELDRNIDGTRNPEVQSKRTWRLIMVTAEYLLEERGGTQLAALVLLVQYYTTIVRVHL